MCFLLTMKESNDIPVPITAEEDIICYKTLKTFGDTQWLSLYQKGLNIIKAT